MQVYIYVYYTRNSCIPVRGLPNYLRLPRPIFPHRRPIYIYRRPILMCGNLPGRWQTTADLDKIPSCMLQNSHTCMR